jgi:hypothetical protein
LSRCLKHTSEDEGKDKSNSSFHEKSDTSNSSNSADYMVKVNKEVNRVASSGHAADATSINCSSDELLQTNKQLKEKIPIDEILYVKLFFCPNNDVLSKNIVIDPIQRLVVLFLF